MQVRTDDDFPAILDILNSAGSDHKFKWILRVVSGVDIPSKDADGRDQKSGEALRSGIIRIEDFGYGKGYKDKYGHHQEQNTDFLDSFFSLLEKNGVKNK